MKFIGLAKDTATRRCAETLNHRNKFDGSIVELTGNIAYHSMMLEANLTPKPGLVDQISTGAHQDMDINTFISSANALRPFMKRFVQSGIDAHHCSPEQLFNQLRQLGLQAEHAMLAATEHINTHKGMIFTLAVLCGAVGWLYKNDNSITATNVQMVVKACCKNLVSNDLSRVKHPATSGEKIFAKYGLTGIRGEAAQGYPTIFNHGLPVYQQTIATGGSEEFALHKTLLSLMAHNCDTNVINRGGLASLQQVQDRSKLILRQHGQDCAKLKAQMACFDQQLTAANLSPGGSADLLAATWFLAQLNRMAE